MECVLSIVDEGNELTSVVATVGGVVVGRSTVPGTSNPRFVETHAVRRRLEKVVAEASRALDDAACLSVCAAVAAPPELVREVLAEIVPIDRERIVIASNVRCDLVGSLGEIAPTRAVVVRADVSSTAWGVNEAGREAETGAFGGCLGDDGSAYWIGRRGIRVALHAHEKRARNTLLKAALVRHFGVSSYLELARPEWDVPVLDRYQIAGFAPEVFLAARQEDPSAIEILEEAGRELAVMALALINELDLIDGAFTVLPSGSVFRARGTCLEGFVRALRNKTAKAIVVREGMGALAGGVLLAVHQLGLKTRPAMVEALGASIAVSVDT